MLGTSTSSENELFPILNSPKLTINRTFRTATLVEGIYIEWMSTQTLKMHTWRPELPAAQARALFMNKVMTVEATCTNTDAQFPGPVYSQGKCGVFKPL